MQKYFFIYRHLKEAIALNKARKLLYKKLTKGESRKISNTLIFWETILLPFAFCFDLLALFWQKKEIPLFEKEIVSMKFAPAFQPSISPENQSSFVNINIKKLKKRLLKTLKKKDLTLIINTASQTEAELSKFLQYNCMIRHLLESTLQISKFGQQHISKAKELNLQSPKAMIKIFLFFHFQFLKAAHKLDIKAAPIQSSGIPILMHDLPNLRTSD